MKLKTLKGRRVRKLKTAVPGRALHVGLVAHTAGERLNSWSQEHTS